MKKVVIGKKIEIFCGTGGVGKTTLATSRALHLSREGLKVLIITIDPSKRLKQILGLNEKDLGKVKKIKSSAFNPRKDLKETQFDALLMAPLETFKFIGKLNNFTADYHNPIFRILMKPHGGLNEIMSIVELSRHLKSKKYDTVVLDTPPGKNFIDFLEASEKINRFFDKGHIEIMKYLKTPKKSKSFGMFSSIVSGGIKKLLGYLEKVTGETFVNHFIDALVSIYKGKDTFIEALQIKKILKDPEQSNWFLVTSVEQQKLNDALTLKKNSKNFMNHNSYLTINKSLTPFLKSWKQSSNNDDLRNLRDIMIKKENQFLNLGSKGFKDVFIFPEILHDSPEKHVYDLGKSWIQ